MPKGKYTQKEFNQLAEDLMKLLKEYNSFTFKQGGDELECDTCAYNIDSFDGMIHCKQCLQTAIKQAKIEEAIERNNRRLHK